MYQRLTVLAGTAFAALAAGSALAQGNLNYECRMGTISRRVEVAYSTAAAVPCEVRYYKNAEGHSDPQVLWSAENETGYCEQKARDFIARLQGMGWTCVDKNASEGSTQPAGAQAPAPGAGQDQH